MKVIILAILLIVVTAAGYYYTQKSSDDTSSKSAAPKTPSPTTSSPTTVAPTTAAPTTSAPTTAAPTTAAPTTAAPTTAAPTTAAPTTPAPTTPAPTTPAPTTPAPTTPAPTTPAPTAAPIASSEFAMGTNYPLGALIGQYVQLTGQKQAILNISRVEIFRDEFSAPYTYDDNSVKSTSADPNNKSLILGRDKYLATNGSEVPSIKINLGMNKSIYKIVVYNRVDGGTQRICGMILSIIDSNNKTVYVSDPVTCPQLQKVGDKTFTDAVTKKATVKNDASGSAVMGTDFDDSYQDLSIYNNCGSIVYFPSDNAKSKKIFQGRPLPIFRGVWCSDNSQLIMRNDFTLTLVSPSFTYEGQYKPYGTSAYVKLQTMATPPPSPNMTYNGDGSITFQNVKYYINNIVGWWRNKSAGTNTNIQNIKLNPDKSITDISNRNIGTYTTNTGGWAAGWIASLTSSIIPGGVSSIILNPYIGSWIFKQGKTLFSFTFNADMTCTNTDGISYPSKEEKPLYIGAGDNLMISFTDKNRNTYKLNSNIKNSYTTFQGKFELPAVEFSVIQVYPNGSSSENGGMTMLRNPFLGAWKSNVLNKPIVFNRDTTVTGYGMLNGQPQDNYSVNPPNSPLTSMLGDGYISGSIKGNGTGSNDNLDIVYNNDTDTIYVFQKDSFAKPVDTLTR